jgi:hypothetical protein
MAARIYIGLVALVMLASAWYLVHPDGFTLNGQPLSVAAARSDVRVMYGAFPLAIGLVLIPGALSRAPHPIYLQLCAAIFTAVALGRLLGLALDHGDQSFTLAALAFEGPAALIGLGLLAWDRRGAAARLAAT